MHDFFRISCVSCLPLILIGRNRSIENLGRQHAKSHFLTVRSEVVCTLVDIALRYPSLGLSEDDAVRGKIVPLERLGTKPTRPQTAAPLRTPRRPSGTQICFRRLV